MPEVNLSAGSVLAVTTSMTGLAILQATERSSFLLLFGLFSVGVGLLVIISHLVGRVARKYIR